MINLTKDIEKAKQVAKILYYKFNSEEGIFGHNTMPEDLKPKTIKWGSEVPSASKYEYLMFITMVVSIDYQRDANKLWEAGRRTFDDETTKWLFFPEKVDLTENEKKVAKVIYKAGDDGISLKKICYELGIGPDICTKLIHDIMRKGVPIQSSPFTDYRFENEVMEAQAKRNFLGF